MALGWDHSLVGRNNRLAFCEIKLVGGELANQFVENFYHIGDFSLFEVKIDRVL